uniref:Ac1 protein n=1 Tax=Allamanda cathartica TaxID=52818 RepID=U5JE25_ALLCA|nr:alpha amylase inhibitor precursor allatide C1 [Allamanda cathartica]AGN03151.1 alpha amylase inhibitor precursor allatide C1 [Allamanda cathartica]
MAKLACFFLLLIAASAVIEVHGTAEDEQIKEVTNKDEKGLPKVMGITRKMLPNAEIMTTILRLPENNENANVGCIAHYGKCDGIINQCCDPWLCTPPIIGICI